MSSVGLEISLVGKCVAVLGQAVELLENIDDTLFTHPEGSARSSVGTHFRHNLDFVTNFLAGFVTGRIDYSARERDLRVETNREYAAYRFREAVRQLENLTPADLTQKVLVRSETIENLWCESSVLRELEFLQSHTIHHFALIDIKLTAQGFAVPAGFGVAPSTLEFWKSQRA